MKTCLICGHQEQSDAPTCPKCGEATWQRGEILPSVPTEPAPVKRGPGRPRKNP